MSRAIVVLIAFTFFSNISGAAGLCIQLFDDRLSNDVFDQLAQLLMKLMQSAQLGAELKHPSGLGPLGVWEPRMLAVARSKTSIFRGMSVTTSALRTILSEGKLVSKTHGFHKFFLTDPLELSILELFECRKTKKKSWLCLKSKHKDCLLITKQRLWRFYILIYRPLQLYLFLFKIQTARLNFHFCISN